ncbi:MAG: hypothetical protein H0W72_12585 [Planctomycetes bacterium]|nr:hypothetical protein [Planctomycetota bacterium]
MHLDWSSKGCAKCRLAWMSGSRDGLVLVAESIPRHARLFRCAQCRAYWEEHERYADVVSQAEAHAAYKLEHED